MAVFANLVFEVAGTIHSGTGGNGGSRGWNCVFRDLNMREWGAIRWCEGLAVTMQFGINAKTLRRGGAKGKSDIHSLRTIHCLVNWSCGQNPLCVLATWRLCVEIFAPCCMEAAKAAVTSLLALFFFVGNPYKIALFNASCSYQTYYAKFDAAFIEFDVGKPYTQSFSNRIVKQYYLFISNCVTSCYE